MKRISNQGIIEILTQIIEMLQGDDCDGCIHEMCVEWDEPCSICKRCKRDYYRKEFKENERAST